MHADHFRVQRWDKHDEIGSAPGAPLSALPKYGAPEHGVLLNRMPRSPEACAPKTTGTGEWLVAVHGRLLAIPLLR